MNTKMNNSHFFQKKGKRMTKYVKFTLTTIFLLVVGVFVSVDTPDTAKADAVRFMESFTLLGRDGDPERIGIVTYDTGDSDSYTFYVWDNDISFPTPTQNPDANVGYYLTEDKNITGNELLFSGTLNICLNGHKINFGGSHVQLLSSDDVVFNLFDIGGGEIISTYQYGTIELNNNSTFNMYGGTICGNNNIYQGNGSVTVNGPSYGPAVFNMYGGSISGNQTQNNVSSCTTGGVNVCSYNTFNMYGGSITNNTSDNNEVASYSGAGVDVSGTFNMYGGTISGNKSKRGGAVCAVENNNVTINGGTITGNKITGTDNHLPDVFIIDNSSISVGGSPVISDIRLNGGISDGNSYLSHINVTSALATGANIGISTGIGTGVPDPYQITNDSTTTYNNPAYFHAYDNTKSVVRKTSDNQLYLVSGLKPTITHLTPANASFIQNGTASTLTCTASKGNTDDSLGYQWYSNTSNSNTGGSLISGANSPSYTVPNTLSAGDHYYYCVVSETRSGYTPAATATSRVATVTVTAALASPVINTQPGDLTLTEGYTSGSTLTVAASCATAGTTLSYQWYSTQTGNTANGVVIDGATSASYGPDALTVGDHFYYCIVTATRSTETQSTTSRVAKITVSNATVPAPPSRNHSHYEPSPEPKFPGGEGWASLVKELDNIPEGGKLEIDMNGTITLPSTALKAIQGKDITLVLNMGNGIKWTINGKNISTVSGDVYLGVYMGATGIPVDIINNLTGERMKMNLMLSRDGGLGFMAILTVPLKKEWSGLTANLFNYNKGTKEMDFVSSGLINADGTTDLVIGGETTTTQSGMKKADLLKTASAGQASAYYTIVIDDHSLDPNIKPEQPDPVTPTEKTYNLKLKGSSKKSKVTLSWKKLKVAKKYRVYQKVGKKYKLVKELKKNKLTLKDKNFKVGGKYTFKVTPYIDKSWKKKTKNAVVTVEVKK